MDRRSFLQAGALTLGAAALPGLAAACGSGGSDADSTSGGSGSGGGKRKVKLGFIALTDCASVVMAQELGYFDERDLDVEVVKQESWPVTRDNLLRGEIDGAHCLLGMPFSVATGIGAEQPSRDLKVAMILNNNGQAITLGNEFADAGYGDLDAAKEALAAAGTPQLAMTFPGGTHDAWLRYWLLATGTKFSAVDIQPVPPPQMVQNMTVGNIKGYCVGEPWNAVAVAQDIGFTHLTTQDIWEHHPEKALVVGTRLTEETDVLKDVMGAVLQAGKWLDDPDNRSEAADTLGVEKYVNAQPDDIRGRLTGTYDLGADLGERTFAGDQMQFFRDGLTNFPRRAYGLWYLAQYQRFGYLDEAPPYQELVDELILTDLYAEVAAAEGVDVPDDDMAPFDVKLDGVTFDPANPDEEAARP
ncbi:MAG TPA: CmpA/NrtA family ABC transporter substrate-binding protein [Acidimicrobiales bacterium]|nr:CmpA/NrtA family ABC transporter substrate-binding protein [Acidimicrobiales bacterium]